MSRTLIFTCMVWATFTAVATAGQLGKQSSQPPRPDAAVGPWLELEPPALSIVSITANQTAHFNIKIRNTGDDLLNIQRIGVVDGQGVVTFESFDAVAIAAGDSLVRWVRVWGNPAQCCSDVARHSEVYFVCNSVAPNDSVTLDVDWLLYDPDEFITWDTIRTGCGISLAVVPNGNMGVNYLGMANMNFPQPVPECDTGGIYRGHGDVYLGDGSPVIIRKPDASTYVASWSIFGHWENSVEGFKPLAGYADDGPISGPGFDGYNSGTFCTSDSLIKIEKTWFAPTGHPDTCKFIVQRMRIYPYNINLSVPGLAIGEAIDWDVPSDTASPNYTANVGGTDPMRNLL